MKKKYDITKLEEIRESHQGQLEDLYSQFIEMGQLKSDFDVEKFTVMKEGQFIAHNFHFMMRQYVFSLSESIRFCTDIEESSRLIKEYEEALERGEKKITIRTGANGEFEEKFTDLWILTLKNKRFIDEVALQNKLSMCNNFEKMRVKLIEMNDGIVPTNEQYQEEMPKYWKWNIENQALWEAKSRITGISKGVWETIQHIEERPVLNEKFQVPMLNESGLLDIDRIALEAEQLKGLREGLIGLNSGLYGKTEDLLENPSENKKQLKNGIK
jgi:hypothetical protein